MYSRIIIGIMAALFFGFGFIKKTRNDTKSNRKSDGGSSRNFNGFWKFCEKGVFTKKGRAVEVTSNGLKIISQNAKQPYSISKNKCKDYFSFLESRKMSDSDFSYSHSAYFLDLYQTFKALPES